MSFYKQHFFSLVNFVKATAFEVGTTLDITPPVYVNLDAHVNVLTTPKQDFLATLGYSMMLQDKMLAVHCMFAVSTYDDAEMVRHTEIMDLVSNKLKPGMKVPLYSLNGSLLEETSWMVVQGELIIDPSDKTEFRSLQAMTVRFLSGMSGRV